MNRQQSERIEGIINLWLSYIDKTEAMDRIAGESPTIMGNMVDFRGDLPESSAYKPETVSNRAERMRSLYTTSDERYAHKILLRLTPRNRELVCFWPLVRNTHNPITKERWTQANVAELLKLTLEQWTEQRERACLILLAFDAETRRAKA